MFDIGWQELFLIAVVALIVIGPKDMPAAMRTMARMLSKIRGLSREFQQGVSEIMREAELDEIRRKVDEAGRVDVKGEVGRMLDPDGRLRSDFDLAADLRPAFPEDGHGGTAQEADERRAAASPPPAATAPRSVFVGTSPDPASSPEVDATSPASASPASTSSPERPPRPEKPQP
jgi:sec-independent protein translocase protein TatB